LVGYNILNVSTSFSASRNVSGPAASTGGLVGYNIGAASLVSNCAWDKYTSAPAFCVRINDGTESCTSVENNLSYFQGNVNLNSPMSSWDFVGVWQKRANDFPVLAWQGLGDVIAPQLNLNKIEASLILSSTAVIFNFTATDAMSIPISCSIYLDNILNQTNQSVSNDTLTNFNIPSISEGNHNWSITCIDAVGNSNSSIIRNFTIDITAPRITAIIYSPNLTDPLDPSSILIFNVTISESVVNVSSVILQYYNGTSWSNSTMTNNSAANYNTTITLSSTETNYTFNILANDSLGNSNSSANQSFSSYWDCSWLATSDLGAVSGWDQNKFIGNLTINNTGDIQYTNNNCTLSFHLTHSFSAGRVYFDNWANNAWLGYYDPTILPAKNNLTITINATFLTEVKQEGLIISLAEVAGRSNQASRNTTATLVSNLAGPYLYEKTTTYPTSVYLTAGEFNLQAYLRNLMGSTTINENNTAYNVSFYLVLPEGITNASGAYSMNYSNITDNALNYLNTNLTFSDLASISNGVKTFTLKVSGYNLSNNLIQDAYGQTTLTEAVNVTFLCYNESDSVIVTSCGSLDGDYVAPTTTVTSSSASGGGGGGSISTTEKIGEVFELIRGEEGSFKFTVKNKYNSTMRNIKVSVTGLNSEYIQLSPDKISKLEPYASEDIQVIITTPKYFTSRRYQLKFDIEASLVVDNLDNSYREQKTVTLLIVDFTSAQAIKMLNQSSIWLKEMNSSGFQVNQLSSLLDSMNKLFTDYDFLALEETYTTIKKLYESAIESDKIMQEIRPLIIEAEKSGISVTETKRLLYLAESAFSRGDYLASLTRIKEAQLSYALETKGEFNPLYYIKNHPIQSSGFLIVFVLVSYSSFLIVKLKLYKRKIQLLDSEEKLIIGLMKVIQKECFEAAKMSMDEYESAIIQYEARLNKIIQEKINTETKLAYLFKLKGRNQALSTERARLVELIRETQKDYMERGKLETRIYENMLKGYASRLSEVEEELALVEAKNALANKGFIGSRRGLFSKIVLSIARVFKRGPEKIKTVSQKEIKTKSAIIQPPVRSIKPSLFSRIKSLFKKKQVGIKVRKLSELKQDSSKKQEVQEKKMIVGEKHVQGTKEWWDEIKNNIEKESKFFKWFRK